MMIGLRRAPLYWYLLPALVLLAAHAYGCPYSIRDAGFIVRDPEPYRFVVTGCGDAKASSCRTELRQAAGIVLDQANVEARVVDTSDETDPLAAKVAALDRTQCALISPAGEMLPLAAGLEYAPALRQVVESPLRETLLRHLIRQWAVVLVVEGTDAAQNRKVVGAATAAVKEMAGFKPEMGEPVKAAPPVLRVRWDDPKEQVLRWALGLEEGDRKQARVAILFGRGRRVGQVLSSAQATTGLMMERLKLLGRNCTCTADPSWLLGPALPLNWGREVQEQVREQLGFDPNSPAVATTLSGVWKTLQPRDAALVPGESVPEPNTGYVEFSVDPTPAPADKEEPKDGDDPPDEGANLEQRSWRAAAWMGAAVTVSVVGGAAWMACRARRRS
ncbi:MAG: hypothetical protein ACM3VW_02750 [Bacteroidota bacterium]